MNERKPIFFTSDTHYNHANSIEFDKRPFRDVEHMNESLIRNYNACVPSHGVCYFLGDFGMGSSESLKKIVSRLNGFKVLVAGNHDKGMNAMYNIGFDVVLNNATLYIAGEEVTLSHCPLRGVFREDTTGMRNHVPGENWHGESRHLQYSVDNRGQFALSGHCHSGPANNKPVKQDKQWDIGVCGNKFSPVSIGQVESWITNYKKANK